MSARTWSTDPDKNAFADPSLPVADGISGRMVAGAFRAVMAGVATALQSVPAFGHTPVYDTDYQALATDTQIGVVILKAQRTIVLPDVDTYPLGQVLFVADESGSCSEALPIVIAAMPGSGDAIAGQASHTLTSPYQGRGFRRGAANLWIFA